MQVLAIVTSTNQYHNHNTPTGLWLSELTHLYDACAARQIKVTITSPKGGQTPIDPESLKPLVMDRLTKRYAADPGFGQLLKNTMTIESINADLYDAVYLAGGHGTMYDFVNNKKLDTLIAALYEKGKIVSAVCHGVCGLLDVKLGNGEYMVSGKTLTGYSWFEEVLANRKKHVPFNLEKILKERGAHYKKALIPLTPYVQQDGNLVTGQNPFSSKRIAQTIVKALLQQHP
jgi:putative intracellular protease/amidase